jgi:hypothetical protein
LQPHHSNLIGGKDVSKAGLAPTQRRNRTGLEIASVNG